MSSPADLWGIDFVALSEHQLTEFGRRRNWECLGELLWGGRGSQVESMASHRKMLIEILNYSGFISGDRVSYPQCSRQLGGGVLILHGLYSVPELLRLCVAGSKFLLEKSSLGFSNCLCILVSSSLRSCISRGLFDANAERHRMFLCWLRAVKSGENQGLYLSISIYT